MYNDVITLVGVVKTVTTYGDATETQTKRQVFAQLQSIGQREFYQASAVGLKPEIKVIMPDYLDYHGEEKVEFQAYGEPAAKVYNILRTYRDGNRIELTLSRGIDK